MLDEQEFEAFALQKMGVLVSFATKHLPGRYRCDREDVVQKVLCDMWRRRDSVEVDSLLSYAFASVRNTCCRWRRRELANVADVDDPENHPLSTETIEQELIGLESDLGRSARWGRLLDKLTPTQRGHYEEWRSRGFANGTHAEVIRASKLRGRLFELSGAEPTRWSTPRLGGSRLPRTPPSTPQ